MRYRLDDWWIGYNLRLSGFWLKVSSLVLGFHEHVVMPQVSLHRVRSKKTLDKYQRYLTEEEWFGG